jgi:hypothetical protein
MAGENGAFQVVQPPKKIRLSGTRPGTGSKAVGSPFGLILWYDTGMDAQHRPIRLNSRVLVELVDSSGEVERREFTLVVSQQADFKSGLLDENTPLGRVLLNHHAEEVIPYQVGDLKEVRILAVGTAEESIPSGAAEKRRSDVQKAEAQSEITNQMIFSTASGSKWGDYDVDVEKLMKENEQREQEQKEQDQKDQEGKEKE